MNDAIEAMAAFVLGMLVPFLALGIVYFVERI